MRIVTLVVLAVLSVTVRGAGAASGTCTITDMRQDVLRGVGLSFGIPIAVGVAMPVEFDEAAGTFSMSRDAWFAQFGADGAAFFVGFGSVQGFLRMKPGTSTGTIERDGTIAIPSFPMDSATSFEGSPPYPDIPLTELGLTTGVHSRAVAEGGDTSRGTKLDFATGTVTLAGCGIIKAAPGTSGDLINGVSMTCTLSPIPAQASLPEPPAFTKIVGKAQVGTSGDKLTLKTAIGKTTSPLAFATGKQSIVNLLAAGMPVVQARLAAFTPKGKKFTASRDDTCKIKRGATEGLCKRDGTSACTSAADCSTNDVVELLKGRKAESPIVASIVVTPKAKATNVAINLTGVDIGALSGPVTLELWVDGRGATGDATASGDTKKKIKK